MSEFNFSSFATTQATSSNRPRLKPWDIYPVEFAGARVDTVQGKKDPSKSYTILKVRFEGEDGYYEESIFYPKEGDDKRPIYKSKDGHEYEGASSFDRTMSFIAQVAEVLNPEGFKKMQEVSSKFKTFDDLTKVFIAITNPAKGKKTKLKLVGRNHNGNIEAALPRFVAVNKQGERFVCDNFLGDKVFFSAYEENERNKYLNAKPTNVEDSQITLGIDTVEKGSEDIDFNSLL
jgi:hypothetical protein